MLGKESSETGINKLIPQKA